MVLPSHKIPALDGLRGVALLCVLMAHAGAPLFGGSQILFVLSGYFITAGLLREHERTGHINIRAFYARRTRRLLPALLVMLLSLNLLIAVARPAEWSALATDTLYTLVYLNNWAQIWQDASSPYLIHLWSLSVQEQFYILWPVVLLPLLRVSRDVLLSVCLSLAVCVCLLRVGMVMSGASLGVVYLSTYTRIDGVFLGCALAVVLSMPMAAKLVRVCCRYRTVTTAVSLATVAIMGVCLVCYPARERLTYVISMPLISLGTTLLIGLCVLSEAGIARLLSCRVLVHLGTISYGVYLWHIPIVLLLHASTLHAGLIGGVCGIVLGEVSYRLIEAPMNQKAPR